MVGTLLVHSHSPRNKLSPQVSGICQILSISLCRMDASLLIITVMRFHALGHATVLSMLSSLQRAFFFSRNIVRFRLLDMARNRPNQALERTAGRCTKKVEGCEMIAGHLRKLAIASGSSAPSPKV